jgi:putative DNA methylase
VTIADATQSALPSDSAHAIVTDPLYYDAVPYAKLANFFYVWQRRALIDLHPELFFSIQIDGANECVVDEARGQDRAYFENKMMEALAEARRVVRDDGVGSLVFAHKTTEGWEALLTGISKAGWLINGSWPIATERPGRLRANQSAALATSIHLVCRPRIDDRIGDWADVLRELPDRVAEWMARLEREGVRGADLVFTCIGPALEIFSRYSRVETAEGRDVPLAEYLEKVWEVVGRAALHQVLGTAEAQARNGGAGALEEDARLTALFLWTLRSTASEPAPAQAGGTEAEENGDAEADDPDDEEDNGGKPAKGFTLIYDIVRRFTQPLGIHLDAWEAASSRRRKASSPAARQGARGATVRLGRRGGSARTVPATRGAPAAAARSVSAFRRHSADAGAGDYPRSRSCDNAVAGRRAHQRAARVARGRAGTRPRFRPARRCVDCAVPAGLRRAAAARSYAARHAPIKRYEKDRLR